MNTSLTPELQKQIEQEAKDKYPFCWTKNKHGEPIVQRVGQNPHGWGKHQKVINAYKDGAETHALKWQEAEQKIERYEQALKEIQAKVRKTIFPAQACTDIDGYITDLFTTKQTTDDAANR